MADTAPTDADDSARPAVAVVEDNEPNRRLLDDFLTAQGYTVYCCAGGTACLELVAQTPLDGVLLDIMMDDLDGLDVLRRLRALPGGGDLPVIMVSARDEAESIVTALNAGANDYITKPVDLTVLRTRLAGHLGRRRAQAALASKEAQLQDVAAHLPGVIYRLTAADPEATPRLTFVSDGLNALLGRAPEAPLPASLAELAADRLAARRLAEALAESRRSAVMLDTELPVAGGDGHRRWLATRATPRRESDGTVVWNGLLIDITARKRAEAVSERLRAALNAAQDMVALIARDGSAFTYVNQGLVDQLGFSEAELLARDPGSLLADLPSGRFAELAQPLLSGERRVLTAQRSLRRADGSAVPADILLQDVELPGGEVSLILIARDVSERAAAIEAVSASEQRLRAIFDAVPVGFLTVDEAGLVRSVNAAGQRLFARQRDDLVGRDGDELFDTASAATLRADLAAFQAHGQDPTDGAGRELRVLDPEGRAIPVQLHWAAWRQTGWFYTAMLRDLSAEKETQAALRQAQKMEAIGQLTGGLAHDFNNLLAVLLGNLELLAEDVAHQERPRQRAQKALQAAERGAALTQRLLAFSRRQPLQPRQIDLNETVRAIVELLTRTLGAGIAVELDLAEDLPPTRLDPGELENVLVNLAINARDAMPEGGTVTVATGRASGAEPVLQGREDSFLTLSVTDTGTGMSPELRGRIFEPFFSTKEVGQGTGLGLATVFGFVQQSGGEIDVDSTPGAGTRFTLYLPAARAGQALEAPAAQPERPQRFDGYAALLVEDDPEVRAVSERMLADLGLSVTAAENGDVALARLDGGAPAHVLVTDMVLPGGRYGPDLAEACLGRRPALAVVFMSGYVLGNLPPGGEAAARAVRLTKPFRREELAARLAEALSKAGGGLGPAGDMG